jgi:hypothetical protein
MVFQLLYGGGIDPGAWVRWYMREISTAMIVANLTVCFPLILLIWRFICRILPMDIVDLTTNKSESTAVGSQKEQLTKDEKILEDSTSQGYDEMDEAVGPPG